MQGGISKSHRGHGRHINMWWNWSMKIASKHEKNFDDFKYCAIYGELTTMVYILCNLQYEEKNLCVIALHVMNIIPKALNSCMNFRRSRMRRRHEVLHRYFIDASSNWNPYHLYTFLRPWLNITLLEWYRML